MTATWLPPRIRARLTEGDDSMTLTVDLTNDDYVALNMAFHRSSPTMRRNRVVSSVSTAVIAMAIVFLPDWAPLGVRWLAGVLFGVLAGVLFFASFPRLLELFIRRMAAREQIGTPGPHVVTLWPEGLQERGPGGEARTPWQAIQKVEQTATHGFIFVGPTAAVIIPLRGQEDRARGFLAEVRARTAVTR